MTISRRTTPTVAPTFKARYLFTPQPMRVTGDVDGSSTAQFDGSAPVDIDVTLPDVNADVGTFGDDSHVAQVTVNAKGQVTAVDEVAIAFPSDTGITQLTGDVTAGPGSGSQAATLAATAVTPGSYTNTNLTVDAKGRIIAASNGSGGGGTPGGSSGQIQYNNAGAFGGFTMSGDATLVASTGVITLANTAVTPASYTYASITVDAKGRLIAASSGTAPPAAANPTASVGPAAVNGAASTFMRSDAAPALANTAVTPGTYTNATVTVDAQGRLTAASNGTGGSGSGLFSYCLSAVPTVAGTGLSNLLGTGAASTDSAAGPVVSGTSGGMGAYTTSVPSTPYTITALIAASGAGGTIPGLGWTDGTKVQFIYSATNNSIIVQSNSNITTFSATNVTITTAVGNSKLTWLRITDDGTNAKFFYSTDGVNFTQAFTVAKSGGFLGGTGYTHIFVGAPGGSGAQNNTVISWTQT